MADGIGAWEEPEVEEEEVKTPESLEAEEKVIPPIEAEVPAEEETTQEKETKIALSGEEEVPKVEIPVEVPEIDPRDEEIKNLRTMNRDLMLGQRELTATVEKHGKSLEENQLLKEADPEEVAAAEGDAVARERQLETFQETMLLNPKYADLNDVVSQENFDDTILLMAKGYIAENGGSLVETVQALEEHIWSQTNPYRTMYDRIKELHPAYRAAPKEEKKPTPADAAPSLASLPAGDVNKSSGWTQERIDGMDEGELASVPTDIYNKYMRGDLK